MSHLFASDDQKYCNVSFSISFSSEYSGLISLKIDWFDLLAVQGTFQSLLQHHSSKASILQCLLIWVPSNTDINQQCLNVTSHRHRPQWAQQDESLGPFLSLE